jgi:hypothetical protein
VVSAPGVTSQGLFNPSASTGVDAMLGNDQRHAPPVSGPTDQEVEQFADEHKNEPGMNWEKARAFLTPQPVGAN